MFVAKATSAAAAHLTRQHRLREFNDTPDQELPHGRQGSVLEQLQMAPKRQKTRYVGDFVTRFRDTSHPSEVDCGVPDCVECN